MAAIGTSTSEVAIWDLHELKMTREIKNHEDSVTCLAISPDNEKVFASSGLDGRLLITDVRLRPSEGSCLEIVDKIGIFKSYLDNTLFTSVHFYKDQDMLVTSSYHSQ